MISEAFARNVLSAPVVIQRQSLTPEGLWVDEEEWDVGRARTQAEAHKKARDYRRVNGISLAT
jgi:hypothetical protein